MRICSFDPSATEIVIALGLGERLAGVSHGCEHLPAVCHVPVLTRRWRLGKMPPGHVPVYPAATSPTNPKPLFGLNVPLLKELAPDVIFTQDLCEVCTVGGNSLFEIAMDALDRRPQFLTLRPPTLDAVLQSVLAVGVVAGAREQAEAYVSTLQERIAAIQQALPHPNPPRVACIEWASPMWGAGLWAPGMVRIAGGIPGPILEPVPGRIVTWKELTDFAPELFCLMPCGYDIPRSRRELQRMATSPWWPALPAVQSGQLYIIDGYVSSRHSPGLVDILETFAEILRPELFLPRWEGKLYERASAWLSHAE